MKHKALWVVGISAALLLLLRKKTAAAASTSPAPTSVDYSPIGLASIYFDPGQTYDINANVASPTYGTTLN